MSTSQPPSGLIKDYLLNQDVTENTKYHQKYVLQSYFHWLNAQGYDYNFVLRPQVIEYKQHLIATKSILTARTQFQIVKRFHHWADMARILEPNPTTGIRIRHRYQGYRRGILTVDQVKELLNSIDTTTVKGLRDIAIASLLVTRGLRIIELQRANVSDLKELQGVPVLYVQRKGKLDKSLWCELDESLTTSINKYLESRSVTDSEAPLFISLSRHNLGKRISTRTYSGIVKSYLRGIGLNDPKITAHSLRHTAAATLIAQGLDLYSVQLYLGHSSPQMTEVYTRMAEEQKRLQNSPVHVLTKLFSIAK